ncbi:MAG: hypothetical protein R3F05_06125 [Planctomycetota bacterium]
MRAWTSVLLLATSLCAACGESTDANEGAVRARIEALLVAAQQDEPEALLPFLAGRGEEGRRVRATGTDREMQDVLRLRQRIRDHLASGAPHFVRFETQGKRSGTVFAWHLTFGDKDAPAIYAFVDINGDLLLVDID